MATFPIRSWWLDLRPTLAYLPITRAAIARPADRRCRGGRCLPWCHCCSRGTRPATPMVWLAVPGHLLPSRRSVFPVAGSPVPVPLRKSIRVGRTLPWIPNLSLLAGVCGLLFSLLARNRACRFRRAVPRFCSQPRSTHDIHRSPWSSPPKKGLNPGSIRLPAGRKRVIFPARHAPFRATGSGLHSVTLGPARHLRAVLARSWASPYHHINKGTFEVPSDVGTVLQPSGLIRYALTALASRPGHPPPPLGLALRRRAPASGTVLVTPALVHAGLVAATSAHHPGSGGLWRSARTRRPGAAVSEPCQPACS